MAKRVLIVDDDEELTTLIGTRFRAAGYETDCVNSGEEAINKARANKYGVAFIDLIMGGIDGVETCREIKTISPDSILYMMTGSLDSGAVTNKEMDFQDAGGRIGYLYKPLDLGEMLRIIEQVFAEKK